MGHNLLTPLVVPAPSCPDFASEALQPAPGIFLTGLCPLGQTERSLRVFWNKVFHTFFVFALLGISHFYTAPVPLVEGGEWVTTSVLPFLPKLFRLMKLGITCVHARMFIFVIRCICLCVCAHTSDFLQKTHGVGQRALV